MKHVIAALSLGLATAAYAGEPVTVPFDGSFEDAAFAVESAILDQGLVIDHVSRVGAMLARTGADVGSDRELFSPPAIISRRAARSSSAIARAALPLTRDKASTAMASAGGL